LKELRRINAPYLINQIGEKLTQGLIGIAGDHGHELKVTGMPSMPYLRTEHEDGIGFHQALCGECTRRGVFITSHHNLFVSAAHTDADLQRTWEVFDEALAALKKV